jgi:hypothetical protein
MPFAKSAKATPTYFRALPGVLCISRSFGVTFEQFGELAGAIESIATIIALAVGAYWTYGRFVRNREDHPLIQFWLEIRVIGTIEKNWIIELLAYVENKGKVQHQLNDLAFDLNGLLEDDILNSSEEFGGQSYFPHELRRGSWLPHNFQYFFVEPGIQAKYSYITHVPINSRFLMLHGWFQYPNSSNAHSAEKTIALPNVATFKAGDA